MTRARSLSFSLILVAFGGSLSSWAAIRTVQFSGVYVTKPSHDTTNNAAATGDCRVIISNTGNSPQTIVGVTFENYSFAAQTSTMGGIAVDSYHVDDTGTQLDCVSGANATIDAGGFCIFRIAPQNVQYDGYMTVCAGTIQVQDKIANQPGSVVATGQIYNIQEEAVLGGLFSGAIYMSGSHFASLTNVEPAPNAASKLPCYDYSAFGESWTAGCPNGGHTTNMNIYCTTACQDLLGANSVSQAYCDENCGADGYDRPSGQPGGAANTDSYHLAGADPYPNIAPFGYGMFGRSIQGYTEPVDPSLGYPGSAYIDQGQPNAVPNGYYSISPYLPNMSGTFTNPGNSVPPAASVDQPAPIVWTNYNNPPPAGASLSYPSPASQVTLVPTSMVNAAQNWPPTSMSFRTANTHYGGGMVYEMIFGPLTSICSANVTYWAQGGLQDFVHSDNIDTGICVGTGAAGDSCPPERLLCAHRHGIDDLYLGSGSASGFVINGGNPF